MFCLSAKPPVPSSSSMSENPSRRDDLVEEPQYDETTDYFVGLLESKLYTETLVVRSKIDEYLSVATRDPVKGDGCVRLAFRDIYATTTHKPQEKIAHAGLLTRRNTQVLRDWYPVARWVKYMEILESEGKRWSKPHVTTCCPRYTDILLNSVNVVPEGTLAQYKHDTDNPMAKGAIYQKIFLSCDGDEKEPLSVMMDPSTHTWLVENGHAHDRFEVGRCIGGIFSCPEYRTAIIHNATLEKVTEAIHEFLNKSTLVPFNSWDPRVRMQPQPCNDTKRMSWADPGLYGFAHHEHNSVTGGLVSDIKHKAKYYLSDLTDFFNIQCLSATIFLFFATITPIITFGAMSQADTNEEIGTIESIVGAALCGIVFALFSGQPLIIISQTGPMLIFNKILFNLCKSYGFDFLSFRAYTCLWCAVFLILIVVFRGSKYVSLITMFTEESFACLVSLIFIVDGMKKIVTSMNVYSAVPCSQFKTAAALHVENSDRWNAAVSKGESTMGWVNRTCEELNDLSFNGQCSSILSPGKKYTDICAPNLSRETNSLWCKTFDACADEAGYFSILLSILVLIFAMGFKQFRHSRVLPTWLRSLICNFGVVISIAVCIGIDASSKATTKKLEVPLTFSTSKGRNWLVNLEWHPMWLIYSIPPALLCCILMFLDQQITAVICNRKDNKLAKGSGYHLDLLIVGILLIPCAILGLPMYVAATVESITHITALKKFDTKNVIPGQAAQFVGVIEQRGTALCVFILIGCSVVLGKYLAYIPLNVLYGVFVLMGLNAIMQQSVLERVLLMITPVANQPDREYLRRVDLKMVHLYTIIQVVCLGILYYVKSNKTIAIGFPVMIVVIVIVRKLLEYVYSPDELAALDP